MLVSLAASPAMDGITAAATSLTTDVTSVIPLAIGVGVLVFGASFLWRTAKRLIS